MGSASENFELNGDVRLSVGWALMWRPERGMAARLVPL